MSGRRHNRASFRKTPLRVVLACSPNALALTGLLGFERRLETFQHGLGHVEGRDIISSIDRAIKPIGCTLPSSSARRAAADVDRILNGAKPSSIQQPTKFELVILSTS